MFNFLLFSIAFLSFFCETGDDIVELQSELHRAKTEFSRIEKRVHILEEKLALQQINMIQKELALTKQKLELTQTLSEENIHTLFQEQRMQLAEIIKKVPSCSHEAEGVLDQILSFITHFSDKIQ